jgi:hypothetical protein
MESKLNIKPELLTYVGDCQCINVKKIFEYKQKEGFEQILDKYYNIGFVMNGKIEGFNKVETFNKIKLFAYKDIPNILTKTFNIKYNCIYNVNEEKIIYQIDHDQPVLMEMTCNLCPWIDIDRDGPHFFLITGYDVDKKVYVCIDPYFSDKYEYLPFDVIDSAISSFIFPKMEVYDFSDFLPLTKNDLHTEATYIYTEMRSNPASAVFKRINEIIDFNKPCPASDVGMYMLSNNELLPLTARFASLSTFYIYLFQKYKENYLLEASKIS